MEGYMRVLTTNAGLYVLEHDGTIDNHIVTQHDGTIQENPRGYTDVYYARKFRNIADLLKEIKASMPDRQNITPENQEELFDAQNKIQIIEELDSLETGDHLMVLSNDDSGLEMKVFSPVATVTSIDYISKSAYGEVKTRYTKATVKHGYQFKILTKSQRQVVEKAYRDFKQLKSKRDAYENKEDNDPKWIELQEKTTKAWENYDTADTEHGRAIIKHKESKPNFATLLKLAIEKEGMPPCK